MKILFVITLFASLTLAHAQRIELPGENYALTDVAELGLQKEVLFKQMKRNFKSGNSICANRAHVWTYDFKRDHNIDSGKLFLFYTKKTGQGTTKNWWYHVTPVINENGAIYTMDAGFSRIKRPYTPNEWLDYFTGSTNCREIQDTDTDLIERMFRGATFPATTQHGTYDCYYRIVPSAYWFPANVARHLLGRDQSGRSGDFDRNEISRDEVYTACVEAVTSPLGRIFGGGKKQCRQYLY